MKKFGRTISVLLVLAIICSLSVTAAGPAAIRALAANEMEERIDEVYDSVYAQLEEQGALSLLDTYMNYYTAGIEASVNRKYGLDNAAGTRTVNVTAICRNGAILSYEDPDTGCYVVSTYLDDDDTAAAIPTPADIIAGIIEDQFSFTIEDVLEDQASEAFEDFLQACGEIGSDYLWSIKIVVGIYTVGRLAEAWDVQDADGYAQIVNAYDPVENIRASVIGGWDEYPAVEIGTGVIDPHLELIPAN